MTKDADGKRGLPLAQASLQAALGARLRASETLDSAELLQGRRFVQIHHNGETYRLQATRLGKLILTK